MLGPLASSSADLNKALAEIERLKLENAKLERRVEYLMESVIYYQEQFINSIKI